MGCVILTGLSSAISCPTSSCVCERESIKRNQRDRETDTETDERQKYLRLHLIYTISHN